MRFTILNPNRQFADLTPRFHETRVKIEKIPLVKKKCSKNFFLQLTPSPMTLIDSDAVLTPLKAAGDLPTQGRARAGSVSSRLSTVFRRTTSKPATPTPSSPATVATSAGGSPSVPRHATVVDNLKSQGRSRLASIPVRQQFNVTELVAAGKQADLDRAAAAQGRSQPSALSSWRARRRRRRRRQSRSER
jgi:hypothetical protein